MWILDLLIFIVGINLVAFVHEFGHYFFTRRAGARVIEFGFGFPPRLFGFYKENGKWNFVWGNKKVETQSTIISVCRFPVGAFVNIKSSREDGQEWQGDSDDFVNKPIGKRFLALLGGVLANFLLAALIFQIIFAVNGYTLEQTFFGNFSFPFYQTAHGVMIGQVATSSPAFEGGIREEDIVVSINGGKVKGADNFKDFIDANKGKEVVLGVKKYPDGQLREIKVTPRLNPPAGQGSLGVSFGNFAKLDYSQSFLSKASAGLAHSYNMCALLLSSLGYIFQRAFATGNPAMIAGAVGGPVAIYAATKMSLAAGFITYLNLMALVSLALAVTNILPLPALDGGRLVFLLYELVTGKKAPVKVEATINGVGFILMLILAVAIIFKDLAQFGKIIFSP